MFAGGRTGSRDSRAPLHSVDILPTILREMRHPDRSGAWTGGPRRWTTVSLTA